MWRAWTGIGLTTRIRGAPSLRRRYAYSRRSTPVVHDRTRFELLWGWTYRFEAYTPVGKRKLGYYALPLLWRDRVIGWANLAVQNGALLAEFGYVQPPNDRAFAREREAELERMQFFLRLAPNE